MWDKLAKYLQQFPDAILVSIDTNGYPVNVRCHPQPDTATHALRLHISIDPGIQAGPGSLLCHNHNEQLWNLKSFAVHGTLERDGEGWIFRPTRIIPGMGLEGPAATIRNVCFHLILTIRIFHGKLCTTWYTDVVHIFSRYRVVDKGRLDAFFALYENAARKTRTLVNDCRSGVRSAWLRGSITQSDS